MIALLCILVPPALSIAYVVLLPHLNHINPWYWRKRYEEAAGQAKAWFDSSEQADGLLAEAQACLADARKHEMLLRSELEMRTDQAMQLRKDVAKAKAAIRKLKGAK